MKQDAHLDFIFRLYNFHQVISSTPTFFCRIFSLLKSNLKAWEHCLVEKLTNTENRTTDLGTCDTFLLIFRVPVKKADYQVCFGGYVDASHTKEQTFPKSNESKCSWLSLHQARQRKGPEFKSFAHNLHTLHYF